MKHQPVIYNNRQLRQRLSIWKKRLRLQDWRVDASIVRARELPGRLAEVAPNVPRKMAEIKLQDPRDDQKGEPRDMEEDLVHELVHLHYPHVTPLNEKHEASPEYALFEQGVELTSLCFVEAYRKIERLEHELAITRAQLRTAISGLSGQGAKDYGT